MNLNKFRIRFSFDDGKNEDLKLVRLLADYDFEDVIFYIPANCELSEREIINIDRRFSVGGHTMSHALLTKINSAQALAEITECRQYLINLLGHNIQSFAYPRGYWNKEIKNMVKEAGFSEARTVEVLKLNYHDPFIMPTTIHCYQRKEYQGEDWLEIAKKWFLKAKEKNGIYHVWAHSWELNRDKSWKKFKELLNFINENQ